MTPDPRPPARGPADSGIVVTVHYEDPWLTIRLGDCRAELAKMVAESVQCVVTSPPYFGLRDYGYAGQIGLEPSVDEYVAALVDVMGGVRRVLRPDGTVWLNLGDSYASHDPGDRRDGQFLNPEGKQYDKGRRSGPAVRNKAGTYRGVGTFKPKDRLMIPARVAIALQADGWWLRDEIVWSKPNPMPSSVRDRTTPSHEMVYLLTKRRRYHYDTDAIRERAVTTREELLRFEARPEVGYPGGGQPDRRRNGKRVKVPGRTEATYREAALPGNVNASTERQRVGLNGRWDASEDAGTAPLGRNKRSVWTVATQPYPEAHFATFPEALITPMILAGSRPGDVVLDPFGGSGTVAVVAQRHGRKAVLIDLSPEYADQMVKRIAAARSSGAGPAIDMPAPYADDGLWGEAG